MELNESELWVLILLVYERKKAPSGFCGDPLYLKLRDMRDELIKKDKRPVETWTSVTDAVTGMTRPVRLTTTSEMVQGTATPVGQSVDLKRDGQINTQKETISRLERQILELKGKNDTLNIVVKRLQEFQGPQPTTMKPWQDPPKRSPMPMPDWVEKDIYERGDDDDGLGGVREPLRPRR